MIYLISAFGKKFPFTKMEETSKKITESDHFMMDCIQEEFERNYRQSDEKNKLQLKQQNPGKFIIMKIKEIKQHLSVSKKMEIYSEQYKKITNSNTPTKWFTQNNK